MCIRDSLGTSLARQTVQVEVPEDQTGTSGAPTTTTPPVVTCLLYTSDAADERSSVDLGGRRIIKKKNTHITKLSAYNSASESYAHVQET